MTMDTPHRDSSAIATTGKACAASTWLKGIAQALLATLESRAEKRRSRGALWELNNEQLADIGITRAEARTEGAKSWFWS